MEDLVLQLMEQIANAELDGPRVRARLLATAPALLRLCQGRRVNGNRRLRRDVALHAVYLPSSNAPSNGWRAALRDPRLGFSDDDFLIFMKMHTGKTIMLDVKAQYSQ